MGSFSLIVLRPLQYQGQLHYANSEIVSFTQSSFSPSHFSQDRLYEPIFSWSPDIDVWSGIADENKRTQLKTLLLNSFEAGVSAENRSFDKLQGIVTQLRTILQETSPLWLPTGQLEVDKDGEDFIVCVSPMVALLNHLSWLLETFQHVPDLVLIAR